MHEEISTQINVLPPFKYFCSTIGELPASYLESMTYQETLVWLCNYLKETIIPTVNNTGNAVTELQNLYLQLQEYVNNYFDNLDVQEEINNKLDNMAQDGSLTNLISAYLTPYINAQNAKIDTIETKVNSVASGSPLVASDTSEMTEEDRIYVNTTDGYWYYYDGEAWTAGGQYQTTGIEDGSIDFIKLDEDIQKFFKYVEDLSNVGITVGQRISATNGTIQGGHADRARTWVIAGSSRYNYIYCDSDTYDISVLGYTSTTGEMADNFITGSNSGWLAGKIFKIPSTYYGIALNIKRLDDGDIAESEKSAIQSAIYRVKYILDTTLTEQGKAPDSKAVGDAIASLTSNIESNLAINASMSMYNKFGVCGASWDNGYIYTSENGNPVVRPDLSWGANVARRNGNDFYNFSRQSMTTRDYLTNQYCLPKLLSSDICDLYIISLGGNDSSDLGMDYLGTINDIKEDYTQNPDTFYGNYARIIERIRNYAPNCKIICCFYYNDETHTSTREAYSEAVDNIANHYNLPRVNWATDKWYKTNVPSKLVHSHPTAVLLSGISYSWERIYSKCVFDNYSYFNDYLGSQF